MATSTWTSSCSLPFRAGGGAAARHEAAIPSAMLVLAQKKAKKTRKIILKDDVSELGKKGQLLEVKMGFFRNYLLPLGKAQIVTPLLIKEMRMEEERIEAEKKRVKEEAQQLALIFQTVGAFKVKRKGGKGKLIFGSVTAQDLVDIIKAQLQRDVDKRIISLPEIRETGEYIAELKLHPEVTAQEYWSLVETGIPTAAGVELTEAQQKLIADQKPKFLKVKNYLFEAIDQTIMGMILNRDANHIWESMKQKY